jgi:hypothetical protein
LLTLEKLKNSTSGFIISFNQKREVIFGSSDVIIKADGRSGVYALLLLMGS